MLDIPEALTPAKIGSFAYITFKDRLPVIIARIVDSLYRNKSIIAENHGLEFVERTKSLTSEMSRLRHELTTDKPLTEFDQDIFGDERVWNDAIEEERKRVNHLTWYSTSFLFGECYMYRRIYDSVLKCGLANLDPFYFEKMKALDQGLLLFENLTLYLHSIMDSLVECDRHQLYSYFEIFLKMSLWGNEADLSLSVNDEESKLKVKSPEIIVVHNNHKILVDECVSVFNHLYDLSRHKQCDVVIPVFLDNSGSELLSDLIFAEFLLSSELARKIVFFTKTMPWYVSDVTENDFKITVKQLCDSNNVDIRSFGNRIAKRIDVDGSIILRSHSFLSFSYPFCKMSVVCPDLYDFLQQTTLVIFKGDLNYRKLVSDLSWPVTRTTFADSLLGFIPTSILTLRVLKCDVQVGLSQEVYDRVLNEHPDDWMVSSRYGVIQSNIV